ncbi:MAG: AbrB/MazE/SpoVT family DNA-binding domain-containing protein [Calditrichia bacterium]|nr:AbrB/MazE/SpoVT family DNA-binding domain-containing protein [Calditrichia bacterium]
MPTLNVSQKGAIVIPAKIRKKYKISPFSKVEIFDSGEEIILLPIPKNPIDELHGFLKSRKSLTKIFLDEKKKELKKENLKWKNMS